jgi:hypothetical protein
MTIGTFKRIFCRRRRRLGLFRHGKSIRLCFYSTCFSTIIIIIKR